MTEPSRKVTLYRQLKDAQERGVTVDFPAPFVNLTEEQLEALHAQVFSAPDLVEARPYDAFEAAVAQADALQSGAEPARVAPNAAPVGRTHPAGVAGQSGAPLAKEPPNSLKKFTDLLAHGLPPHELARILRVPLQDRGADRAGLTFNTHGVDDPVRVDNQGRIWFQDEVIKPAVPKSRVRRKVRYIDTGSKAVSTLRPTGSIDETFEVPGERREEREIKVTLPSYQSGIFLDRRYPFRVFTYNGNEGFTYRDIVMFYGGKDNVPGSIKTKYVNSDLAFDIRSVLGRLEQEHRDLLLQTRGR